MNSCCALRDQRSLITSRITNGTRSRVTQDRAMLHKKWQPPCAHIGKGVCVAHLQMQLNRSVIPAECRISRPSRPFASQHPPSAIPFLQKSRFDELVCFLATMAWTEVLYILPYNTACMVMMSHV